MLKVNREIAKGRNRIDLTTADGQKIKIEFVRIDLKRINLKNGSQMAPSCTVHIDAPKDVKIKWSVPNED